MSKDQQYPLSPDSRLDEDWDFATADTMYSTHALHPYLAAMIPQIPRKLLDLYARPGIRVFDPFVGGGSVIVESYLAGLRSTGLDVNPLAVMISKAKTSPISSETLKNIRLEYDRLYPVIEYRVPDFSKKSNVRYWFKPYMFEPLTRIRATIAQVIESTDCEAREATKNLLECVYSYTVRSVSLTYRNEIELRHLEPEDLERFNPDVLGEFIKRLEDASRRVAQLPVFPTIPQVVEGDTRYLEFGDNEFDLTITSPPYGDVANTIPYHQFSKNMLYWLGMDDSAVANIRLNSLGSKKTSVNGFPRVNAFKSAIAQMSKEESSTNATLFYSDYYRALKEIARVTSERIIVVVGHRVVNDVIIDNPTITTEIMRNLGWKLEAKYNRTIRRKRLSKKMGMASNFQGAMIDREAILVYVSGRFSSFRH